MLTTMVISIAITIAEHAMEQEKSRVMNVPNVTEQERVTDSVRIADAGSLLKSTRSTKEMGRKPRSAAEPIRPGECGRSQGLFPSQRNPRFTQKIPERFDKQQSGNKTGRHRKIEGFPCE